MVAVGQNQVGKLVLHQQNVVVGQRVIYLRVGIILHIFQMLPDGEILPRQLLHLAQQVVHQFLAEGDKLVGLVLQFLQLPDDIGFQPEDSPLQRNHHRGRLAVAHVEESKIIAEIEDIKAVLVRPVHQTGTKACAASDHLPEFRLAHDLLEKHKVENLRHVHAGVQHIDGNGDLGLFLRVGEIVNRLLREFQLVVDHHRVAGQVGVFLIEYFQDKLRVTVISRKNNCLAEVLAVVDAKSLRH